MSLFEHVPSPSRAALTVPKWCRKPALTALLVWPAIAFTQWSTRQNVSDYLTLLPIVLMGVVALLAIKSWEDYDTARREEELTAARFCRPPVTSRAPLYESLSWAVLLFVFAATYWHG